MGRSRRRRHEDELAAETHRAPVVGAAPDLVSPLQRRVLDLQRDAGNTAVARLLQGQGAVVARAARGRRQARGPMGGVMSITIPGLLAHVPVSFLRLGTMSASGERPRRFERAAPTEVTLEVSAGSAIEPLRDAMLGGTLLPWASIAGAGFTYLMVGVLVAGVEPGPGGRVRLMLSANKVDVRS